MEMVDFSIFDDEEVRAAINALEQENLPQNQNPPEEENGESSNTKVPSLFALVDSDVFDCPKCGKIMRSKVYQCNNGHYVCESCRELLNSQCATCPLRIESIRCLAIERVVESALIECDTCNQNVSFIKKQEHDNTCQHNPLMSCVYKKYGCIVKIRLRNKPEHEKTCYFIPLSCPYDQCNYTAARWSLNSHHALHPRPPITFTFNTTGIVKFELLITDILLVEANEKIRFVLRRIYNHRGSFVSVRCVAQPTELDMKFTYSLKAQRGDDCIFLISKMELVPDFHKPISLGKSHLITNKFHTGETNTSLALKLTIRKVIEPEPTS